MSRKRTVFAFLATPFVISLIVTMANLPDYYDRGIPTWRNVVDDANFRFGYAYAVAIVFGIPAYFLLKASRCLTAITIMLSTAAAAAFPSFAFWAQGPHDGDVASWTEMLPRWAPIAAEGLIAGAIFWLIIRPNLRLTSDDDASSTLVTHVRIPLIAFAIVMMAVCWFTVMPATVILAGFFNFVFAAVR